MDCAAAVMTVCQVSPDLPIPILLHAFKLLCFSAINDFFVKNKNYIFYFCSKHTFRLLVIFIETFIRVLTVNG